MAQRVLAPLRHEPPPTKGSRFIASVTVVHTADEAKRFVQSLRDEMPDATHHCWALRLARPALERAADDGEPGGSAGRPILAAMTGRDLVDVCVVVTRYYGGTKLGVGGLVRAYGGAAAAALDLCERAPYVITERWRIEHGYEDGPAVERALAGLGVDATEAEYGARVVRWADVPAPREDEFATALRDATAGRVTLRRDP